MEDHINVVLNDVNKEYNLNITYYTIGPNHVDNPTCHEWILETELPA